MGKELIPQNHQKDRFKDFRRIILENFPFSRESILKGIRVWTTAREKCEEQIWADLTSRGLLGEHKLKAIPRASRGVFGDSEGHISAEFFLLMGNLKGDIKSKTRTYSTLQFFWQPHEEEDSFIVSEIPVSKIHFIINEKADTPTVEFKFNIGSLTIDDSVGLSHPYYRAKQYPHPNDYLDMLHLESVDLKINPQAAKDLPNFIALPSPPSDL